MELLFEGSWTQIQKEMRELLGAAEAAQSITVRLDSATLESAITKLPETAPKAEKAKAIKAAQPPVSAPIVAPTTSAPVGGFDFKKIEEIIPKALEAVGRGKVVTLLEKYGAKKGSELKPTDYEAFFTECQALANTASLT